MNRWFRVDHKAGWDGTRFINGRWHLIVVRDRYENGRRYFGAACGPVALRPSRSPSFRRPRNVRLGTPTSDACPHCIRVRLNWPKTVRRPFHIRRTVCGRDCGGWTQRDPEPGLPVPCSGWHRNKRLWCEADAKWAITSVGLIGMARKLGKPDPQPFFRCTYCARGYREGWLGEFHVERLMDPPPSRMVAA